MKLHLRLLFLLIASIFLSSCASLNKQQCMQGDWNSIGYQDGIRGYDTRRIEAHKKACSEYGVTPRMDSYMNGHARGIEVFCRPHNGFQYGLRGNRYRGVCPVAMEASFRSAYQYGFSIFQLKNEVNAQYGTLKKTDHKLQENRKIIKSLNAQLHKYKHHKHKKEKRRVLKELHHYRHKRKALLKHRHVVLDRIDWLNKEIDARLRNNPFVATQGSGGRYQ